MLIRPAYIGSPDHGLKTTERMTLRKRAFRLLAAINRKVLPKQWHHDLGRLSKARMALAGYRYWVTKHAL